MFKHSFKASGKIEKEPKIDNDKVYLTLSTEIPNKEKSESYIYLELTKKQWDKIKDNYLDHPVSFHGYTQARKTKAGIPLLFVKCHDIEVQIPQKNKTSKKDAKSTPLEKQMKSSPKPIEWYKILQDETFVEVDIHQIYLKHPKHLNNGMHLKIGTLKTKPLAIKQMADGTYELIVGLSSYLHAKIHNKPVQALITDLTHEEFVEQYCYEN